MNFIKKQTVSTWISLAALILTIVGIIIYGVNVSSAGYFQGTAAGSLVAASVVEIILLVAVIVVSQFNFKGIIGWILDVVVSIAKIVAAFLPMVAMLGFLSTRMSGLATIFFSNVDILATIQTPENLSSAYTAIACAIIYGVTTLVAVVGAFFRPYKKAKASAEAAA